jgi:hypothetical protein
MTKTELALKFIDIGVLQFGNLRSKAAYNRLFTSIFAVSWAILTY